MKLLDWIQEKEMNVREFSKLLKVSHVTVYEWIKGNHRPNYARMLTIEKLTNGDVTYKDWT